jgi:uncharacterized RDD family membrane protein YckC
LDSQQSDRAAVVSAVPLWIGAGVGATAIVFIVEASVLTWLTGSSFGQRISGLGVASVDGGRLPLWRALLRNFLICLVIPAVVYDNQGRGLHDRLAGTYVVKVR